MSFTAQYSDEQRLAVAEARGRRVSCRRVSEMAAAGELVDVAGEPLAPFTIPESSVSDVARKVARSGLATVAGAVAPSGDPLRRTIERQVRDLLAQVDRALEALRADARPDERRMAGVARTHREVLRMLEELERLPVAPAPRPTTDAAPGSVGPLLADHRDRPRAEPVAPAPVGPVAGDTAADPDVPAPALVNAVEDVVEDFRRALEPLVDDAAA